MDSAPGDLPATPPALRQWRRRSLQVAAMMLVLLCASCCIFTGPRGLARYPANATSPYKLPWPAGVKWLCVQSNRGIVSHRGREEFAFDFLMPEGSDVRAARGGVVTGVNVSHDGHGLKAPNNFIAIAHGDGTSGWYLHLRKDGSLVRVGERVEQGQRIAKSGHVGRSLAPHLHFQVRDDSRRSTIPISFADVTEHAGVPRMWFHYTSGNKEP